MLDVSYDDIRGMLAQSRVPQVFLAAVLIVSWPLFLTHYLLSYFICLFVFADCFTSVVLPNPVSFAAIFPNKSFTLIDRYSEGVENLPR